MPKLSPLIHYPSILLTFFSLACNDGALFSSNRIDQRINSENPRQPTSKIKIDKNEDVIITPKNETIGDAKNPGPTPPAAIGDIVNSYCRPDGRVDPKSKLPKRQIRNASDLRSMVSGQHYELVNDIELSGPWEPLGEMSIILRGNGYTISGLDSYKDNLAGLFESITCSYVDNIKFASPRIRYANDETTRCDYGAGTLAASVTESILKNISVENGTIIGGRCGGGMLANNVHCSSLSDIKTSGAISNSFYGNVGSMGGIFGSMSGCSDTIETKSIVQNSSSSVELQVKHAQAGVIGGIAQGVIIRNVVSEGLISNGTSPSTYGGMIGLAHCKMIENAQLVIQDSLVLSRLELTGRMGGIVSAYEGCAEENLVIKNTINALTIVDPHQRDFKIGGVLGMIYPGFNESQYPIRIDNVFFTAHPKMSDAIMAQNGSPIITGTGPRTITPAEALIGSTYTGFDFVNTWKMTADGPRLKVSPVVP